MTRRVTWTRERDAIMARDWPANVERKVILARVNELPGTPIKSCPALKTRARVLGLKRGEGFLQIRGVQGGTVSGARHWPPGRDALLREIWAEMLARLNAEPAAKPVGAPAIARRAHKLGLERIPMPGAVRYSGRPSTRSPAPKPKSEPPAPPEPTPPRADASPEAADAALARRQDRARALLRRNSIEPQKVASIAGLPLREVFRLQGEVRKEGRA